VSGVDEDVVHDGPTTVTVLAERKAGAVDEPGALVLACDSVVEADGRILGKPSSPEEARAWWRSFRGATVTVWTGHCVVVAGRGASRAVSADVRFGQPSDDEIARYVASGEALDAAGAFRLDGRAAAWIDAVDGDPGSVHGVSFPTVRALLAVLDIVVTDLWR
jgi:septum formation protein